MEFQIMTDLSALPKVIDFNFDVLKSELDVKLGYYRSLVVTEDGIKSAKGDRAALNALKKAIDDRRKEVKKQCLAPYEAFEVKCKELTGMIDCASASIDEQVKAFEELEKAEKRAKIEAAYHSQIGEYLEILPFELFYNAKWLNKGQSLSAVTEELTSLIESSKKDIAALRDMHLSNEAAALSVYSKTRDLGAAMAENMRLQKLAAEAERNLPPADAEIRTVPGHGELTQRQAVHMAGYINASLSKEAPKTIKVVFYDTTAAFRADMRALTERHSIRYGGIQ